MALNSGIQTYQILTNYDEVSIPSLSSILLAVHSMAGKFVHMLFCVKTKFRYLFDHLGMYLPSRFFFILFLLNTRRDTTLDF